MGSMAKTEANINSDFELHDALPPEYLRMMANLRFAWTANDCWERIEQGCSFKKVKAHFESMENDIIKNEVEIWSLHNDTIQRERAKRLAQSYDLDPRLQLQVRSAVGPLLSNVQQWRHATAKRRRQNGRRAHRPQPPQLQPLLSVCTTWPRDRLGSCRANLKDCLCYKAALAAGLVKEGD